MYIDNPVCAICQRQAVGGRVHPGCRTKYGLDGLVVGFRYRGAVKLAVKKIKYRWVFDVAETLVSLFSKHLWKFNLPPKYILVPIPLHRRRANWRGFNQAELICKILSKKFGVGYEDLLERVVETKTQVGLSKEERKDNIRGAFKTSQNAQVKGKTFILVDDVYTTGATMAEACKVLKKAGAREVWAMTLALG